MPKHVTQPRIRVSGRSVLRAITTTLATAAVITTGTAWALAAPTPLLTPIAAPTGAHPVGRIDTELASPTRELMVSVWYPAAGTGPAARYVPAGGPLNRARIAAISAQWLHTPGAAVRMTAANTVATEGAPVAGDRLPVVILSPGLACPRFILSGLASDLASRGYVAVVMDHVGESPAVEFPDGEMAFGVAPSTDGAYMRGRLRARISDTRLTLDRLPDLPTVGPHLDLTRVAVAGHSYGGTTAVHTMAVDGRVAAAIMIDSPAGWTDAVTPVAADRPVLSLQLSTPWPAEWARQYDAEHIQIVGAGHYSATDMCAFDAGEDLCGTLGADQAAQQTRTVIADWLDHNL